MAEAAGIFVSHAHEDNAWCRVFVEALRQGGATVWYDEHNLGYGVIGDEIERELQARPIFIVILSPASVDKPWVRREMDAAMRLRDQTPQRIILPVMASKTEVPLFWRAYKWLSGPGDSGLTASEAAGRVIHTLAIVPTGAPASRPSAGIETTAEAVMRGDSLYTQKRYQEALAAYDWALTLNPENAEAWNSKGTVLHDLRRYNEALTASDRATAIDPAKSNYWYNKGTMLYRLERYRDALAAFDRALALNPQYASVWNNKGVVLYEQKRYEEALAAWERALAIDPENASAWDNKIRILNHLRRITQAQLAERQRDEALRPR
jgi:tetratricopeptide (TPR) repeat protein